MSEFVKMRYIEVMYRLNGFHQRRISRLNEIRLSTFHNWRGQGVKVGGMPLQYLWQVFSIPEIDGDIKDSIKFTTVRKATDEELELIKKNG